MYLEELHRANPPYKGYLKKLNNNSPNMYLEELLSQGLLLHAVEHVYVSLVQIHHTRATIRVSLHSHQSALQIIPLQYTINSN